MKISQKLKNDEQICNAFQREPKTSESFKKAFVSLS